MYRGKTSACLSDVRSGEYFALLPRFQDGNKGFSGDTEGHRAAP